MRPAMLTALPGLAALLGLAACAQVQSTPKSTPPPPHVSYAWATFDTGGIQSSGASGSADRASRRQLTIDDPVRITSVSKLVVALGVMRLVEQGQLDLDEDVSVKLGWSLRNPKFAATPITLRSLLSHQSSLKDDIDYAIPLGGELRTELGKTDAFDTEHPPGTYFRYANLNFPVIAAVMERATGERFDRLIHRLVTAPLELDACFNWSTCSDASIARAVVLYDDDGSILRDSLGGARPACLVLPKADGSCDLRGYESGSNGALFSPQGGLRVSARDLATVGQVLLNKGRHRGKAFLTEANVAAIIDPAWQYDGTNGETEKGFFCAYGLGVQILPIKTPGCNDKLFADGRSVFGHSGEAYRVRSGLWVDPVRGVGIAYFAANNGTEPPYGKSAYRAVEEWLASKLVHKNRK